MKAKSIYLVLTVLALASAICIRAVDHERERAADRETNKNYRLPQGKPATDRHAKEFAYEREPLGEVVKASDIIGRVVRNPQDEKLGEVEDLGVDLKSGRIVLVILSTGALGIGKDIAVPPQAFQCDHERKVVRLDTTKERLKTSPKFEMSQWDDYSQSNRVVEVYRFYDQHPYFTHTDHKRTPRHVPVLGTVMRASKIIGLTVRNQHDEKLGTVNNLMINLESGRVSQVIVSSGGFLGVGDELSVMPPASFSYGDNGAHLILDATKESLGNAPRFKSKEWPNFSDPEYSSTVYRAYRIEPYFKTQVDADNTGRNVRDRDSNQPTSLDQGTSPADIDTTRQIRREVIALENLSVNARNVKIITKNGEVTLRGPVNTLEEKRQIAEIAARYAPNARVINQLEVKGQNN